jgi:MFS family permease
MIGHPDDHAGMALLRNRNFALLFTGQGVSRLGDGLYVAVMTWLAWSLTHAIGAVAVVTIAANAPTFAVTLIGASYADRYDRRRLMIGTDLARGVLVGVAALLLALSLLHFALLVAFAAVLAAIGAPFAPARDALVARIAPADALVTANGLLQVSFRSAFFVGPLLLAPLLAIAPMPVVLTIDALTFAVSASTLTAMHVPAAAPARTRPGLREDLGAGLAALRREPDVLLVIATFVLALAAASGFLTVGVIALVGHRLGGHAGQYGLLIGIAGVAEVFGALVIARLPLRHLARTAVLAWVLLGAFRFPLGLATNAVLAAGLLAVTGFASALTDIPLIALVQQRIPDRHLSKALGLWEAGIAGAIAIAPLIATAIIDSLGVSTGFMLSGAALIVIGTAAALVLHRTEPPDRDSGRLTQEPEHLGIEPLGDRRGGGIVIGRECADHGVEGHPGSAVRCFLDEDGDRRVGASVGYVAGHLAHGDRVAGDQADQPAAGPVQRFRIERQRVVQVELPEPHQAGAALRLLDQGAELLIGAARLELAEQLGDIGLADTTENPRQDLAERPVAGQDVTAHDHVEHVFRSHGFHAGQANQLIDRTEPTRFRSWSPRPR